MHSFLAFLREGAKQFINHKRQESHHNAENCGFVMIFFPFFLYFQACAVRDFLQPLCIVLLDLRTEFRYNKINRPTRNREYENE